MAESWVINASPVILLAKAGLIERVPQLSGNLVVPEPVAKEITDVHKADAAARWPQSSGKQFIVPSVAESKRLAGSQIGAGERSVISWALVHSNFVAVLDDQEARVIAQNLGVTILGTIGVVLRLKKAGLIAEAKTHLLRIKSEGDYMSDELFQAAVRGAGEQP